MIAKPTTHRVHPQAAEAWLRGDARPPGEGFEEMPPAKQPGWLLALEWLALIAISWGIVYVLYRADRAGFVWLWQEIAAGRIW